MPARSTCRARLRVRVSAAAEGTLLAEISAAARQRACRRARATCNSPTARRGSMRPVVHAAALLTMLGWVLYGATWHDAIVTAIAVLIITCPCALGLAIPAVQTVVAGAMFRTGVLLNSGDAIERSGRSRPRRVRQDGHADLPELDVVECRRCSERYVRTRRAARTRQPSSASPRAVARASEQRLPLGRASRRSQARACVASSTGLEVRLGRPSFCGAGPDRQRDPGRDPEASVVAFRHGETQHVFRGSAAPARRCGGRHCHAHQGAGSKSRYYRAIASLPCAMRPQTLGIREWRAGVTPADKIARIEELKRRGVKVLMVGDGMNDAPALAAAHVSMSPVSATHLSQATADLVFLGDRLAPVVAAIGFSRKALRLMRQNLWLAAGYNLLAVPLAIAGLATPLVAAAAMSGSSLLVILNALACASRRAGSLADGSSGVSGAAGARARHHRPDGFSLVAQERPVRRPRRRGLARDCR